MKTIEAISGIPAAALHAVGEIRKPSVNVSSSDGGRTGLVNDVGQSAKVNDSVVERRQFGVLNADKEATNEVAARVRALGEVRKLVARASDQLDLVVKSFPPFPPGSVEREQYLNSVVGIRSIIEKLTIPREPRAQLEAALGQDALVNGAATDDQLNAGQKGLINADRVLADIQASIGEKIAVPGNASDEAYYMAESKRIGAELARQGSGISRTSEAVLALLG